MNSTQTFWNTYATENETEWCKALSQLLGYDTVSGDPDPKALKYWQSRIIEGFNFLHGLAREMGFVTRYYDPRVLVIEMPGPKGASVLGFPIHLDVVPAGEGWTRKPFGGEIADGAIWGRGAQDDKGPIIQALYGLKAAAEYSRAQNKLFQKTVRIIIVSEEELGVWDDIPFYFERESPPDFSIVPDAHFPITNGEKGFIDLEVKCAWTPALDGEFEIVSGDRSNVVPSKASLRAGGAIAGSVDSVSSLNLEFNGAPHAPEFSRNGALTAKFHGVGSHGSTPAKGYNAATDALRAAAALPGLKNHPSATAFAWLAQVAASLDGNFVGIAHRHEKVGATTVNLGVLRADANGVRAVLNIRNPIGLSGPEILRRVGEAAAQLQSATPGLTLEVTSNRGMREPIYVDPEQFAQWINPMREAYQSVTGREAGLQSIGGTTFAKAFPNAVCFGPVDPAEESELAHEADEHVTLKAMRRNVEIYGRTIISIAL